MSGENAPVIPGYQNFRLIGRGGSATVYRAHQVQLERDVAIKVLRPGTVDDRTRRLFDVERRLLGQLPKHQNIVTVFEGGFAEDGDPYLVMELCPSGSLAGLVKTTGPIGLEHVVRVGSRIASALDFAHRRQMIHRDVKPENVLISDLGEPVLSDFGIASLLTAEGGTTEGGLSPHHVAPELLRGAVPAASADLYSLGSTIFTLLVGYTPHQRAPGERLQINQVLSRVADTNFVSEIPASIDATKSVRLLLSSLLAKDPVRRMGRASDAVMAFRSIEHELGIENRELALPTQVSEFRQFDINTEDDERTFFAHESIPTFPPRSSDNSFVSTQTAEPSRQTSDSIRVRSTAPVKAAPELGDLTVVSVKATKQPAPVSSPVEAPDSLMAADRTLPKKQIAMVAAALLAIIAAVVVAVRVAGGSKEAAAVTTAGVAVESIPIGLSTPGNILIRVLDNSAVEISWSGNSDPGVQYEVEAIGDSVAKLGGSLSKGPQTVAQSPLTVTGLDLSRWTPCFRVTAVNTSTSVAAAAEPVCVDKPSSDSTVGAAPTAQGSLVNP